MSERKGPGIQKFVSVESFADSHGLDKRSTAYALVTESIPVFVDSSFLADREKTIIAEAKRIARQLESHSKHLANISTSQKKRLKNNPEVVRALGRKRQAEYRNRKRNAAITPGSNL